MPKRTKRASREFVTYFHRGDWHNDPGVRVLTSFEKGVWMEIILLVDESEERGYAVHPNGKVMSVNELAAAVKGGPDKIEDVVAAIHRLVEIGVASVDFASRSKTRGAIFCRRIVRDEATRQQNSRNGSKGGRPPKKIETNSKSISDPIFNSQQQQELGISVTKSESPSIPINQCTSKEDTPNGVSKKEEPHELPDDFEPSEKTLAWVAENCPSVNLKLELRRFKNHFLAASTKRTSLKKDWQRTFENWCAKEEKESGRKYETAGDKKDRGFERERQRIEGLARAAQNLTGSDQHALPAVDGQSATDSGTS